MLELVALPLSLLLSTASTDAIISETHGKWQITDRSCEQWSPDVSNEKADVVIAQTRECKTRMVRNRYQKIMNEDGSVTRVPAIQEERIEISRPKRMARGAIDESVSVKKQRSFGPWIPEKIWSCEQPLSIENKVSDGQLFFTAQSCQADLFRQKKAVEVFRSGSVKPRPDLSETERRRGDYTIVSSHYGQKETWVDDGFRTTDPKLKHRSCAPFQIEPDWSWGMEVSFPVTCQETWVSRIEHLEKNNAGKRRVSRTEPVNEERAGKIFIPLLGKKDLVVSESFQYSDWSIKGKNCFGSPGFSPIAPMLTWGVQFIEVAQCRATEYRQKSRVRNYASGHVETISSETESRNLMRTDTRHAQGGVDRQLSIEGIHYGEWYPDGALECTGWIPHPTSIAQKTLFVQTNRCSQSVTRDVARLETWLSGRQEIKLPQEKSTQLDVAVQYQLGVGLVAISEFEFDLSAAESKQTVDVPPRSKSIRLTVSVKSALREPLKIMIGNAALEVPSLPAGDSQFYFDMKDFNVPTGLQTITIISAQKPMGQAIISFD